MSSPTELPQPRIDARPDPRTSGQPTPAGPSHHPVATPPQMWGYPAPYVALPPHDGLSIAGFVTSFVIAPLGFVLSLVGLRRTQRHGTRGRGLAIAGIVISSVWFAYIAVMVALGLIVGVTSAASAGPSVTSTTSEASEGDTDHTSAAAGGDTDAYLADLEAKAEDTYTGYSDESLIGYGQYTCDALDADGDVDTASHDTASMFGLGADDTGAALGAAVLDLYPQFTPLVRQATGNPTWGA